MISIVLPVYNGEKFLSQSLDSILNQTCQDFELIIVNDCSTDRSESIIRAYMEKDARIRLINNKTNKKLPASLNIGFSEAKGDLMTWTSDDNLYYPTALEELSNKIAEGYEFAYSDLDYIDQNGKLLLNESHIGENIWYKNNVGACFMYTRKAMETVGQYDTTAFLIEDYDYWLRIYTSFPFGFIPKKLYAYRLHGGSLSSSRRIAVAKKRVELISHYLEDSRISETDKCKMRVQLAETCYDLDQIDKVREYLSYLRAHAPQELQHITKTTRLSRYFSKNTVEFLKKLLRR